MKQIIESLLKQAILALQDSGQIPQILDAIIKVNEVKDPRFGDYATNLAWILATSCQQEPLHLAQLLMVAIPVHPLVKKVEIGGAGFINFFLQDSALSQVIADVLNQAKAFGISNFKPEQAIAFDLELAKSVLNDMPVFYIQYAHARICSVFRQIHESQVEWDRDLGLKHLHLLDKVQEIALLSLMNRYPEVLKASASLCEPYQIAYHLRELAQALHSYFNAVALLCELDSLRAARLCLIDAVRQIFNNGLELLGVSAAESI